MAFGHGVSVTTLQLANAYSVFASEGVRKQPSLLRIDKPLSSEKVLSPDIVRQVLPMMEAVTQLGGTGTRASVPSFRVAGKTGTVHKLGAGGYSKDRYLAVFAGLAPVSHPRYVIAVMIDEPNSGKYYGGEVAAPVFAQLMQGVLQLMGAVPDALPVLAPAKINEKPKNAVNFDANPVKPVATHQLSGRRII
jgi:cell division protein FtsI (penicillin-binding protein 3)